jgi:hypothetical protein
MSSIQRWLDEPCYDLLEAGAAEAQANLRLLVQLLNCLVPSQPRPAGQVAHRCVAINPTFDLL